MDIDSLFGLLPDAGATLIVLVLVWYQWEQSKFMKESRKQQHERTLARDQLQAELIKDLMENLVDCFKGSKQTKVNTG